MCGAVCRRGPRLTVSRRHSCSCPASEYVIDDTWNVVGLAGTGSKTLQLKDVFVPEHRVLTFSETTSGKTPGASLRSENPSFSIPMLCNIPSCLASVAVGTAAGALEDYLEVTSKRVTRGAVAGGNNRMAEFPTIQLRVAEAAAATDAAREILLRDLRDRAASVRANRPVSVEDRIASRRGQAFAVSPGHSGQRSAQRLDRWAWASTCQSRCNAPGAMRMRSADTSA